MTDPFADNHTASSNPFDDDATISNALYSNKSLEFDGAAEPSASAHADRINDLTRREEELRIREENLNAKAEHIRKHGRNNWPPLFPLIFHDIDMEIPDEHKATVLTMYRIWMSLVIILLVNLVSGVFLLISGAPNGGADLIASIFYVPVIAVLNFLLAYRPVYSAYMKESAVFYYVYFVFGGFHILFCTYMFMGIPSSGASGLFNLISRFATGHILAGVFCILATVGWAVETLGSIWMYKQIWAHSHGEKGHTFAQAKAEMQLHGIRAYLFKSQLSTSAV